MHGTVRRARRRCRARDRRQGRAHRAGRPGRRSVRRRPAAERDLPRAPDFRADADRQERRVAEGAAVGRNCRVDPEVTDAMWSASLEGTGAAWRRPPGRRHRTAMICRPLRRPRSSNASSFLRRRFDRFRKPRLRIAGAGVRARLVLRSLVLARAGLSFRRSPWTWRVMASRAPGGRTGPWPRSAEDVVAVSRRSMCAASFSSGTRWGATSSSRRRCACAERVAGLVWVDVYRELGLPFAGRRRTSRAVSPGLPGGDAGVRARDVPACPRIRASSSGLPRTWRPRLLTSRFPAWSRRGRGAA
jgi:hypothetical protein